MTSPSITRIWQHRVRLARVTRVRLKIDAIARRNEGDIQRDGRIPHRPNASDAQLVRRGVKARHARCGVDEFKQPRRGQHLARGKLSAGLFVHVLQNMRPAQRAAQIYSRRTPTRSAAAFSVRQLAIQQQPHRLPHLRRDPFRLASATDQLGREIVRRWRVFRGKPAMLISPRGKDASIPSPRTTHGLDLIAQKPPEIGGQKNPRSF